MAQPTAAIDTESENKSLSNNPGAAGHESSPGTGRKSDAQAGEETEMVQILVTSPDDNSECNDEKDDGEFQNSRFLKQLHPAYAKKPGVQKDQRKLSHESASPGRRRRTPHLLESKQHTSMDSGQVSPSRLSVVTIDQIPHIIEESLQNYLQTLGPDFVQGDSRPARPPRVSVFSLRSRSDSNMSDSTFWELQEAFPNADNYGLTSATQQWGGYNARPTLYQLREESVASPEQPAVKAGDDLEDKTVDTEQEKKPTSPTEKKGWIQGVLIRCLLNIFGVMLFLRLTWITGQAGIGLATVIVLLSSIVTTLTTMSMAAICTNGEVGGGGAYYMISRSLGPEFGGAIGVIFSLASAVAAAMHIIGFAESLRDLVKEEGGVITGNSLHDAMVIGVCTSVLLLGIVMVGLDFETKAQIVLLVVLVVSIVNYTVGTFLTPSEEQRRLGFVGYDGDTFLENMKPDFRKYAGVNYNFFEVFAIYFPSATGILAGANISGDLKNPSVAIPRGTFLAILLTSLVYILVIWTSGGCMLRDAAGTALALATNVTATLEDIQSCSNGNDTCKFGVQNWHGLMGTASAFQPLIYAGIFAATLSSALASLIGAPKVFQALGQDKLFPFIKFFAKGYGKNGEPKRGYILAFAICAGMTCIGSLDVIAPIISNFFLMAYAIINFSCFDVAFANSPGFRPSFHFYNKWASLVGALLCVGIMFMLSWWAALVTVTLVVALYAYIKHKKPDVNWGSSGEAHTYKNAIHSALKLADMSEHVKNFRPQMLVLSGYPKNRPAIVDFAASITKRQSLLMCAQIFQGDMQAHVRHLRSTAAYRWFRNRHVRAFYTSIAAPTVRHGTQALLQCQGLGKLRPNTLLVGFKNNWQSADPRSVHNYAGIIHDAFDLNYGVAILRMPGGLNTFKVSDIHLDSTDDTLDDIDEEDADAEEDVSEAEEEEVHVRRQKMSVIFSEHPSRNGDVVLKEFVRGPGQQGATNYGYSIDEDDDGADDNDDKSYDVDEISKTQSTSPSGNTAAEALPKQSTHDNSAVSKEKKPVSDSGTDRNVPVMQTVLSTDDSTNDIRNIGSSYFREKRRGTIDVWWLFDDGGLGLLLPYILSRRKKWKQCKMRVFCTGRNQSSLDDDRRKMEVLLKKFRVEYSDVIVIPDLRKKPCRSSYKEFENLIYQWRLMPGETQDDLPWKISDADISSHKQKIYMQLTIREKLLEYSKQASLVVVTLPVPRKFCPAGLYMAWLDTLTRDLPPTLLLRGNQQSVLTYFS